MPAYWLARCRTHRQPTARRHVVARSDLLAPDRSPTGGSSWARLTARLQDAGVTMIKAQEVAFCTEKGYIILDVRTEDQYEEGFIEGAINVPLYQLIQGWQPFKVARRIGYAAFGVLKGTEPNPRFLERAILAGTRSGLSESVL